MAQLLTPTALRRGFFLFAGISLCAWLILVLGDDAAAFLPSLRRIEWQWMVVGVLLASVDWVGGGLRLWVLLRVVHPNPSLRGAIIAGGMGAWGSYVTPMQSGASPMIIYSLKRAGVPISRAMTTTLMSFIATVVFFAIAGPMALFLGAGEALSARGVVLGMSLLDLFKVTMAIFAIIGLLLLVVMVKPQVISSLVHRLATALGARSRRVAARLDGLRAGIDQAHESMQLFNTRRGWAALGWAVLISGPSHGNRLLAGYVALRAIGVQADFVDILLLQTLITFLLYFAPTPGGSGVAEFLSASIMGVYLTDGLKPLYTLIWRLILSWLTIGAGFVVFSGWVKQGLRGVEVVSPHGDPE